MKYKVGDKVRVRNDLKEYETYYMENDKKNHNSFVSGMKKFSGKVVTIESYFAGQYRIEEDSEKWRWVDEMFEGLAEETPKRKFFNVYDTVRHDALGIGTVIKTGNIFSTVDFDEWNEALKDGHILVLYNTELTLVQAYTGGEAD